MRLRAQFGVNRPAGSLMRICGMMLGIVLLWTGQAQAQFRTSVQGTVTDPTGAVVPGATVTLKNNGTNETVIRKSDAAGVFNFNALPAADFNLTATATGFKPKTLEHLHLIPEQPNSVTVEMEVGGSDVEVTVNAETVAAVDTDTSNIGVTISANDIQHAPSFNRDVFTLTQLAPGAVGDASQSAGGGVYALPGNQGPGGSSSGGSAPTENRPQANANGSQSQNNGISVDGISTVSAVWGGASVITPTEESIDNVRIVTNDYDAENARFAGAQTMVTSKSGTNQFHGSAFIAIHRPGLNAYNHVVRDSSGADVSTAHQRDTQRFNQYGGSLGGPIIKDKIFAFFAYETSPNNSTATATGWYETPQFRAAAGSGSIASTYLNFAGSTPSGTISTTGHDCTAVGLQEGVNCRTIAGQGLDIGSPLKTGLGKQDLTATLTNSNPGVGGGLDGIPDVAFYNISTPTSSYYRQYNGRLDANVTQKDHLSFAIYWVPQGSTSLNGSARAYNLFHHNQINEALSGIWNHTFSANLLNEARVNASGWRYNEIASNPQEPVGLPQDFITFFAPSATLNYFGAALGSDLNQWTYGFKDVATKIIGPHTIKFGADDSFLHYLNNPISLNYTFYNIWDFLNDAPSAENGDFNSATGVPSANRSDERENIFGAFVQDDWKVRPNLTLHIGVRYAYYGSLYAKQGNLPAVRLGAGSAAMTGLTVATHRPFWNPQAANFGPQLGFNWSPSFLNSRLVIRGGYGLNYQDEEIAISANTVFNPPTQNVVSYSYVSPTNPGPTGGNILYVLSSSPTSLAGFPSNPHAITSYNSNGIPTSGSANVYLFGDGNGGMKTIYLEHYSLDSEYQMGRELVLSAGYQGSVGRHLINHENPNAAAVAAGWALNPLITGSDWWTNGGSSNNNALLLEAKHPMLHRFTADAQFQWAKSLDTDGSGPYYEDPYFPENPLFSYGRSEFDVGKSFKLWALWQPVIFHGSTNWMEKVVGGWSLSGIYQYHTGFPYSPTYSTGSQLYYNGSNISNLRPIYLGGGGNSHSNDAFINHSNFFPKGATVPSATANGGAYSNTFFAVPNFARSVTPVGGGFPNPNQALPPPPGADRNSFTGPSYRDIDMSLAKNFGLPKVRWLGEGAGLEIRADAFNLFNILNLNPANVTNDVTSPTFGQDRAALGGRTITLQARFSF